MIQEEIWRELLAGEDSEILLRRAMQQVAQGLSNMMMQPINVGVSKIKRLPISMVATHSGSPETEMVGIYLRIETGLRGQALMMLPLSFALNLVDLVMGLKPGSTVELDMMGRSALAEVGNLTLSYFLNSVSHLAPDDEMFQPSTPAVMVDMLGAILNIIAAPAAFISDYLYVIETIFRDVSKSVWMRLWILPDPLIDWSQVLTV